MVEVEVSGVVCVEMKIKWTLGNGTIIRGCEELRQR